MRFIDFMINRRCPEDAPTKQKMVAASSIAVVKAKLNGFSNFFQATGFDELVYDEVLGNVSAKGTK